MKKLIMAGDWFLLFLCSIILSCVLTGKILSNFPADLDFYLHGAEIYRSIQLNYEFIEAPQTFRVTTGLILLNCRVAQ